MSGKPSSGAAAPVRLWPGGDRNSGPRLLMVDGHAYAYRSFHAIRNLSSPAGEPTNAIFGFVKAVNRMLVNLNPTHVAVAWDGGLAAERVELLPGYKAQRPPMPGELEQQLDGMVAWVKANGCASICLDGVEADDIIGTLTRAVKEAGAQAIIASGDKDFMQLIDETVGMFNPNDKSGKVLSPAGVEAKTGVQPTQIVDWLSLVGDAVDNIPGVPGVGVKTATRLLQEFGSCSTILARTKEIPSARLREGLEASAARLELNRKMVELNGSVEGVPPLADLARGAPDHTVLRGLYTAWGFGSLVRGLGDQGLEQAELFA